MAVEKFVHTHESYSEGGLHDHPSMASHIRRLDTARQKEWEHEQEDLVYYERRYGEVIGDQWQSFDHEYLEKVRNELRSLCE